MGRPVKPTRDLADLAEANDAMMQLLLATNEGLHSIAAREVELARVSASYEVCIEASARRAADLEAQLKAYYMRNIAEIEKDGVKSLQLTHGTVGRRTTPPALSLLNKGWKWATVEVKLRALFGAMYFRQAKPEIDKDKIKDPESGLNEMQMRECGLRLTQDDKFYAEPALS